MFMKFIKTENEVKNEVHKTENFKSDSLTLCFMDTY